jgi:FAD/FMN-containing dehydrogenase
VVVRPIGIGHSPNEICVYHTNDTKSAPGVLHMVDLKRHMNRVLSINVEEQTAVVEGGTTIKELIDSL